MFSLAAKAAATRSNRCAGEFEHDLCRISASYIIAYGVATPKISSADRPDRRVTIRLQSRNLGPRTGCLRYLIASSREEMANFLAVGLEPSPLNWGKINHIQWLSFFPLLSSAVTLS